MWTEMVRSTMKSFTPWCAQSAKRSQRFTRQSAKWWGIKECKAITASSEHTAAVHWVCSTFHEHIHVYTKWEQTPNKHHCSATHTWRIFFEKIVGAGNLAVHLTLLSCWDKCWSSEEGRGGANKVVVCFTRPLSKMRWEADFKSLHLSSLWRIRVLDSWLLTAVHH